MYSYVYIVCIYSLPTTLAYLGCFTEEEVIETLDEAFEALHPGFETGSVSVS